MMSSIAKKTVITAVAVAALAACAPKPAVQCDFTPMMNDRDAGPPELTGLIPDTMKPVPLNTVSVIDRSIQRKVLVQSVSAGRSATGNMTVETRLMNCTDHPLQVEGRTNFLTVTGAQAEPASMWQRLALPPRSFATYSENGVSGNQAATFLVEVKEGH
jgi:hypothetical protein